MDVQELLVLASGPGGAAPMQELLVLASGAGDQRLKVKA